MTKPADPTRSGDTTAAEKTPATIYEALHAALVDVAAVSKDGYNQHQRFNYRGIDHVLNAVNPVLKKHGLVILPIQKTPVYTQITTASGKPAVSVVTTNRYRLMHISGEFVEVESTGEANDAADKATAKANSVALRTLLIELLCLPTGDTDPDADYVEHAHPTPPPQQQQRPARQQRTSQRTSRGRDRGEQEQRRLTGEQRMEIEEKLVAKVAGIGSKRELTRLWNYALNNDYLTPGLKDAVVARAEYLSKQEQSSPPDGTDGQAGGRGEEHSA